MPLTRKAVSTFIRLRTQLLLRLSSFPYDQYQASCNFQHYLQEYLTHSMLSSPPPEGKLCCHCTQ